MLFRVCLAGLLLFSQLAYSLHDLDDAAVDHAHGVDCYLCFSGHFGAAVTADGWVALSPLPVVERAAEYSPSPRPVKPRTAPIRAPPSIV